jgi:hypothetical protein
MTPEVALCVGVAVGIWIASVVWVLARKKETGPVWLTVELDKPNSPMIMAGGRMVRGVSKFTLTETINTLPVLELIVMPMNSWKARRL